MDYLTIFQSVIASDTRYIKIYLEAFEEHQIFSIKDPVGVGEAVKAISALLSKASSRGLGLQLLNALLKQKQDTEELLKEKLALWITMIFKAFDAHQAEECSLAALALTKIAAISHSCMDLSKTFTNNYLAKIYETLANTANPSPLESLFCIHTCLRLYPGPSGASRAVLQRYLVSFVDSDSVQCNTYSGRCHLLLQQVHGGGVNGANHKAQWKTYQLQLLGSLHAILDEAFSHCTEYYDENKEVEQLALPPLKLNDEPIERTMQLYIRFRNLLNYLSTALSDRFPVPKSIAPKRILNLIKRGLAVTCEVVSQNAIYDNLALGVIIPKAHYDLLTLLETMIKLLRSQLISYHQHILGLFVESLKWTSSKQCIGSKKPFSKVRIKSYELVSLWCNMLQSGSRCELVAEFLIPDIFEDIASFEMQTTLKLGNFVPSAASKSKKARRHIHRTQNEQTLLWQKHAVHLERRSTFLGEDAKVLCIGGLRCLQHILTASANFIKAPLIKTTQIKVLKMCRSFYTQPMKRNPLFFDTACRTELFNTLNVLLLAPNSVCPPPFQEAVSILQTARQRDDALQVRNRCTEHIINLEKIVHPNKEGLMYPTDIKDVRNAFLKLGKEHLLESSLPIIINLCQGASADAETDVVSAADNTATNCSNMEMDTETDLEPPSSAVLNGDNTKNHQQTSATNDKQINCATLDNFETTEFPGEKTIPEETPIDENPTESTKSLEPVQEDSDLMPPPDVKQKLIEEDALMPSTPKDTKPVNESVAMDTAAETIDEDALLAEIEACFVDELN